MSDRDYYMINQYIEKVTKTDELLGVVADCLEKSHRPAILVFYGDHLPNFNQKTNEVLPQMGIQMDKDGFEGLYVPDNRIDEAARKAGSQALGNVNVRIPGASFITSAANAAVSAVQSVAQQTISEQKINISSNYLVTIKQPSK